MLGIMLEDLHDIKLQATYEIRKIAVGTAFAITAALTIIQITNDPKFSTTEFFPVFLSLFSISVSVFITGFTLIINGLSSNVTRTLEFNTKIDRRLKENSDKLDKILEKLENNSNLYQKRRFFRFSKYYRK